MKISVIIPVFNEERTISEIVSRVQAIGLQSEIIIVNDGSTDGTAAQLETIDSTYENVRVFEHKKNRG
ncbi:MAG: glycosyltransferase, partial [Desulfobacterales bacterium]